MQEARTFAGAGWLRARSAGSSTARYRVSVGRDAAAAEGTLDCELSTMIEVQAAGRGVLVLADGKPVEIELTDIGPSGAAFTVIGRFPPC